MIIHFIIWLNINYWCFNKSSLVIIHYMKFNILLKIQNDSQTVHERIYTYINSIFRLNTNNRLFFYEYVGESNIKSRINIEFRNEKTKCFLLFVINLWRSHTYLWFSFRSNLVFLSIFAFILQKAVFFNHVICLKVLVGQIILHLN